MTRQSRGKPRMFMPLLYSLGLFVSTRYDFSDLKIVLHRLTTPSPPTKPTSRHTSRS
jgi:hypothetical protein